ncbi:hypothetical protein T484DRAFT_1926882 [Baffinella frigidus]|nr:hypothetical protein T484DRAFT_1926882 [Cryptophyta sp. CCMP2293]|mmetsp:Transcript_24194/g.57662  ORF Transcript_24194/g.57662 Transcript_24194/m.57662 type:complete len:195 (+) Transcript_24194:78-662(+)
MRTALAFLWACLALSAVHRGECHGGSSVAPRASLGDMLKDTARDVQHTLETSKQPILDLRIKYAKPLRSGAAGGVVGYVVARTARNGVMGAVKVGCVGVGAYLVAADLGYIGRDPSLEEVAKDKAQRAKAFLVKKAQNAQVLVPFTVQAKTEDVDAANEMLQGILDRAQSAAVKSGSFCTFVGGATGALLAVLT